MKSDPSPVDQISVLNQDSDHLTNDQIEQLRLLPKDGRPPATFEEYLAISEINDWPEKVTDENLLKDFEIESPERLLELLKSSTFSSDTDPLQDLEGRLDSFKHRLWKHAEKFRFVFEPDKVDTANLFIEHQHTDHKMEGQQTEKAEESEAEKLYNEMKRNSIDSCKFPGFDRKRLTDLPGSREPAPILETVTAAQSFKPEFQKIWHKIFQSEASVAILLDAFWWTFLDRFQSDRDKEKSHLFDRIADSFVALISSIHFELKDRFLVVYSECLAQALFVTYYRSFPESLYRFDEALKEYLIRTTHEWVSGGHPPAGRSNLWSAKLLEVKTTRQELPGVDISALSSIVHGHYDLTAKAIKFENLIAELDVDMCDEAKQRTRTTPRTVSSRSQANSSQRRLCEYKQKMKLSSSLTELPHIERVQFNLKAQSPLVSHYLKMLRLRSDGVATEKQLASRSQIVHLPAINQ